MSQKIEHEKYLREVLLVDSFNNESFNCPNFDSFTDYKNFLIELYEGKTLLDIKGAKNYSNSYGEAIKIVSKNKIDFKLENINFQNQICENLKLIPGIGPNKESKLKKSGYNTIHDLKNHDSYSDKASKIANELEFACLNNMINLLKDNVYGSDCKNNIIKCASLVDNKNFKFMDIETLGLFNCHVILIGVSELKNNSIITTQYLLKDKTQEEAVLYGYLSHLNENSVHVTFNGATFDIPFIKNRCDYYKMNYNLNLPHFDLIYFARNLWKFKLPNCKLTTIEESFFNFKRQGDVPGAYIPDYYETYLKLNNIGPLIPIIDHNRQDIVSLASFLMKIYGEVNNGFI